MKEVKEGTLVAINHYNVWKDIGIVRYKKEGEGTWGVKIRRGKWYITVGIEEKCLTPLIQLKEDERNLTPYEALKKHLEEISSDSHLLALVSEIAIENEEIQKILESSIKLK